jgi:hypothetical protein
MYIDRESIYELIKEIQGRKGFPAQLGWPTIYFFI